MPLERYLLPSMKEGRKGDNSRLRNKEVQGSKMGGQATGKNAKRSVRVAWGK